jgi:hypothetical protein
VILERNATIMRVEESHDALGRRVANARDVIAKPPDSAEHHAGRENAAPHDRASGDEKFAGWRRRMTAWEFVQVGYEHEELSMAPGR